MTEAPSVEAAWRSAPDGTVVIGVGWSGDERIYNDFITDGGLTFPQIDDTSGVVFERFDIPFQPAAVLITPTGATSTVRGAIDATTLAELLSSK